MITCVGDRLSLMAQSQLNLRDRDSGRRPPLRVNLGSRHAWGEATEVEPVIDPETTSKSRIIPHSIAPVHDRLHSLLAGGKSVGVVKRSLESW